MNPNTAINTFNNPATCRAERAEIATALWGWIATGGYNPSATFNADLVASLRDNGEMRAALCATRCNERINRAAA